MGILPVLFFLTKKSLKSLPRGSVGSWGRFVTLNEEKQFSSVPDKITLMCQSRSVLLTIGISWITLSLAEQVISRMALTGFGYEVTRSLYLLMSVLS